MRVSSSSTMAVIAFHRHGSKPTIHCCSSSSAPIPRETKKNARLIPPRKRIPNTIRLPEPLRSYRSYYGYSPSYYGYGLTYYGVSRDGGQQSCSAVTGVVFFFEPNIWRAAFSPNSQCGECG